MQCFHPWTAYRTDNGAVVFKKHTPGIISSVELRCGQCWGCRLNRSREWAVRCMHEAQLHEENCFITLTYNDDNVPEGNSLNHRHFQLFMKRLRKTAGKKLSFYMCGEYGETFSRPHFHAAIFGYDFKDKEPIKKLQEGSLFRSAILEHLWPYGYSTIGAVTFQSAAYIARYVMKKITGDLAKTHYTWIDTDGVITERTPEYNRMSLRPAIGKNWLAKFGSDVYPSDEVIERGRRIKPPRYYDKQFQEQQPDQFEEIQHQRYLKALPHRGDNTDERLRVKEQVEIAKTKSLKRSIA